MKTGNRHQAGGNSKKVKVIRFALYAKVAPAPLAIVAGFTAFFLAAAIYAYNPSKGLIGRRGTPRNGGA